MDIPYFKKLPMGCFVNFQVADPKACCEERELLRVRKVLFGEVEAGTSTGISMDPHEAV